MNREVVFELKLAMVLVAVVAFAVWLAGFYWRISASEAAALGFAIGAVLSTLARSILGGWK